MLRGSWPVLVSVGLLGACRSEPTAETGGGSGILYAGCARERIGLVCELDHEGTLTLWRNTSFRTARIAVEQQPLEATETATGGGYRITIARADFPLSSSNVPAELLIEEQGRAPFRLRLVDHRPTPELRAAIAAKDAGELERARSLVSSIELRARSAPGDPEAQLESLLARGINARVALRTGEPAVAAAMLEENARELYALGQISEAGRDVFARAFILATRMAQADTAADWLESWRARLLESPLMDALMLDNQAMVAATREQPLAALRYYGAAELMYDRLGESRHAQRVAKERINLLGMLGQTRAALIRLEAQGPPPPTEPACNAADFYELRAWLILQEAQADDAVLGLRVPEALEQAANLQRRCRDPVTLAAGLIDQGLWALDSGQLARARAVNVELNELEASSLSKVGGGSPVDLATWLAELRGRIALTEDRVAAAREQFTRELELANAAGQLDAGLRGHLGLAAAARAVGDEGAVKRELDSAIDRLERADRWASFGRLVHTQLATRQQAARELVSQLVRSGDVNAAFRVALRAYAAALRLQTRRVQAETAPDDARRAFEQLRQRYQAGRERLDAEAQADWERPADELDVLRQRRDIERLELERLLDEAIRALPQPAHDAAVSEPAPHQYWLLFMPSALQAERWLAIGSDGNNALATELTRDELYAVASVGATHPALETFAEALRSAREIVLFPAGAARHLDFERWLLDGVPLRARRLAFGMGLARTVQVSTVLPRNAGVIADPTQDLPFARLEAPLAARALGAPPEQVLVGENASPQRVLDLLARVEILHFAGHVRRMHLDEDPSLLLAGGVLEAWELFSLGAVPRAIVLSACGAGDGTTVGDGGGFGLAQSLLALGAEFVIAPVEVVEDEEALHFQEALYGALAGGDLREAFWQASSNLSARGPNIGHEFRLFVR